MLLRSLALLAATTVLVSADVKFTTINGLDIAGATFPGGTAITVNWADSGVSPSLSQLASYQLFLCAGGNTEGSFIQLTALQTQGLFTTGNTATGTIPLGVGASAPKNAYFLKMISVATQGGTVTNYSPRFTLTGMTGGFPAAVVQGLATVAGTEGPATVNNVANNPAAAPGAGGVVPDEYNIPFYQQTGLTKYAGMQPVPGTKITKKNPTPLNPTSAFDIARTFLPRPTVLTTMTLSQTFSVSSIENPATPAAMPADDMQKFLNRWKD